VDLSIFIAKWKDSGASERANKDSFLNDLRDALGVARPDPKTGDPDRDRYERAAAAFKGSRKKEVESILESLAALGLLIAFDTAGGKRWRAVAHSNA
jgi:hypothetical protein